MLSQVVVTTLLWTSLYYASVCIWKNKSYEWVCRSISLLHALLTIALSYYSTFILGPWPFTHAGLPNTPFQEYIAIISVGYFIFDFIWCLYFKTDGQTMLFHHFVSIGVLSICLITGWYGTEIVATIFGSEVSNPLLQYRWYLRDAGYQDTFVANFVDISFVLTFTFVRLGVGSYLLYCYLKMPHIPVFMRIASTTFYLISWAFWITILKFGYRKCLKIFRKNPEHISPSTSKPHEN